MPKPEETHYPVYGFAIRVGDELKHEDEWVPILDILTSESESIHGYAELGERFALFPLLGTTSARREIAS